MSEFLDKNIARMDIGLHVDEDSEDSVAIFIVKRQSYMRDEPGILDGEYFEVNITRTEMKTALDYLEKDWEKHIKYCKQIKTQE